MRVRKIGVVDGTESVIHPDFLAEHRHKHHLDINRLYRKIKVTFGKNLKRQSDRRRQPTPRAVETRPENDRPLGAGEILARPPDGREVALTEALAVTGTRGAESEPDSESESPGVVATSKESESESIKLPRL